MMNRHERNSCLHFSEGVAISLAVRLDPVGRVRINKSLKPLFTHECFGAVLFQSLAHTEKLLMVCRLAFLRQLLVNVLSWEAGSFATEHDIAYEIHQTDQISIVLDGGPASVCLHLLTQRFVTLNEDQSKTTISVTLALDDMLPVFLVSLLIDSEIELGASFNT
jgi:hypothetical protein